MTATRVALVTLGCARNEVDSEELAARLAAQGFELVDEVDEAQAVLVNTCGFIEAAKRESLDTLMSVGGVTADGAPRSVVAVGCMAERYGRDLAAELPEAAAVLGFDEYPQIAERLRTIVAGGSVASHVPRDRRTLLPMAPVDRPGASVHVPGHGGAPTRIPPPGPADGPAQAGAAAGVGTALAEPVGPGWMRRRISSGPVASLKIASGCDRRCAFCAIPSFRGSFVSRPAAEVLAEAHWLVGTGVRELVLVSENSTSYGKDLGTPGALEALLGQLSAIEGIERIRVAYLQPAEVRPALIEAMLDLPRVADHFDLSFQHASAPLLRRMRRFGGTEAFLDLIATIRAGAPQAGIRSNVIVGFPGETTQDIEELIEFLGAAQLDAVGVFGYSDEDGTEAAGLSGALDEDEIRARVSEVSSVVDEVMAQRAEQRIGSPVEVLIEALGATSAQGRAAHQGPEDGTTTVHLSPEARSHVEVGTILRARVVGSEGVDLAAVEVSVVRF
ncbi:MAG: radical SAM protein [Candidatus Nanopelagicales bacterium]